MESGRLGRGRVLAAATAVAAASALAVVACERRAEPGGAVLYARHCASCHGAEGHGDGPVAPALKTPPPDLTLLARRNGGRFDERAVLAVIDGRHVLAAHGTREMPVWGAVFAEQLAGEPYGHYTTLLHAKALTDYLGTIQQR